MITEIEFKGQTLKILYVYDKGDSGVWRDSNGDGVPPSPSSVEITEIHLGSYDVTELLEAYIYDLEYLILTQIEEV